MESKVRRFYANLISPIAERRPANAGIQIEAAYDCDGSGVISRYSDKTYSELRSLLIAI